MRILRIADIPADRHGGMSRTMYCTGDALASLGHQVDYAFTDAFRSTRFPKLRRFTVPLQVAALVRRRSTQAGEAYDVVEVHEPLAAFYALARRLGSKIPPLVVFSYGLEERSHRGALSYRKKKRLSISLKARLSPLTVVWQARYAVRHADHVICSNSEDVDYLRKRGISSTRLTQHHTGVDDVFLQAGKDGDQPRRVGVLFLGTWVERKGILDLVPALVKMMRTHRDLPVTIAGCLVEPAPVLACFPDDLHQRVRIIPRIDSDDELIHIYRSHSILVLPSYFEGQPLVLMEAAAMGLALLTTSVCGMRDFVHDRSNGLLVDAGDEDALAARLDDLVRDPTLVRTLGAAARTAVRTHTWVSAAAKIERAYNEAVRSDRRNQAAAARTKSGHSSRRPG